MIFCVDDKKTEVSKVENRALQASYDFLESCQVENIFFWKRSRFWKC